MLLSERQLHAVPGKVPIAMCLKVSRACLPLGNDLDGLTGEI